MATYGTRNATRFKIGDTQYYTLVETSGPNKGRIIIKSPTLAGEAADRLNQNGSVFDRTIGTIPLDNSFRPYEPESLSKKESEYFSSAAGQKAVKNHAVITAQRAGATARDARQLIFPNTASPGSNKPGQQQGDSQGGNPGGGAEPEGNDTQPGTDGEDKQIPQGTPNGTINITEQDRVQFAPNGGLRYPSNLSAYQDRIEIVALALKERTGATTKAPDPAPASTTPAANSSGKPQPPSSQSSGSATSGGAQNSGTRPGTPTDDKADSNAAAEDQPNLSFSFGQIEYVKIDNPVVIAIQAPISDQNSVEWSSGQVNALEAAAYDAAIKAISSNELGDAIKKVSDTLYNVAGEQGQRIRRLISGEAAGISNILARTDNIVLNPNLELLFSGPQLRTFTLTFKMSARDDKEALQIRRIINYFKYHMAVRDDDPGASASKGLFLRAPHTFEIKYKLARLPEENDNVNPREHPSISKIKKPCALTNMTVDYTPLGSYSTYEDGSMVAYIINLQFQEMTPVYSSDYSIFAPEKNANASIGY